MTTIGNTIIRTARCDDSMAWARQHSHAVRDGTLFIPDVLTRARGRHNRTWLLEDGQCTMTCILKPLPQHIIAYNALTTLTMALSIGLVSPFIRYGAQLKWPNDCVFDNKKYGGMLMETIWVDHKLQAVILGFSLNITNAIDAKHPLADIATSVCQQTTEPLTLETIQALVINALDTQYQSWKNGDYQSIYTSWKLLQRYHNVPLHVHERDGSYIAGIVTDYLPTGELVLTVDNNPCTIPLHQVSYLIGEQSSI